MPHLQRPSSLQRSERGLGQKLASCELAWSFQAVLGSLKSWLGGVVGGISPLTFHKAIYQSLVVNTLFPILSPPVVNPLTPKISLVILLTVWHTILMMSTREFGIGSTDNPLIDNLLYSHHFYAWYCTDIIRRNSLLITHGINFFKNILHEIIGLEFLSRDIWWEQWERLMLLFSLVCIDYLCYLLSI